MQYMARGKEHHIVWELSDNTVKFINLHNSLYRQIKITT